MSTALPNLDKEGDAEDVRESASISVAISNYVATAALGVLAGAVVLFTYVSGAFAVEDVFYWLIGAGVLFLVASIFVGGRGSGAVAKAVGDKEYCPKKKNKWYNWQATLTLLGLFFVLASVIAGVTVSQRHSDLDKRLGTLEKEVAILRTQSTDPDNDRSPQSECQWHASWRENSLWRATGHHWRCQ